MINKKGEDRYLSPIMFIVWALIALSFIIAVLIFYGGDADIRELENIVLINRVADCITEEGNLKSEVLLYEGFNQFNILESCRISDLIFNDGDMYLRVLIFDQNMVELRPPIEIGENLLEFSCNFQRKDDPFALCAKRRLYLQDSLETNEKIIVEIVASSRNEGREL